MKYLRVLIASLGLCACAGIGKYALSIGSAEGKALPKAAVDVTPKSLIDGQGASALEAAKGVSLLYDVDFDSSVAADSSPPATLVGSMKLTLRPLPAEGERRRYLGSMQAVSVVFDAHGAEQNGDLGEMMTKELSEGTFAIELDASGRLTQMAVPKQGGALAVGLQRTLMAALQFVRPNQQQREWSATESDHIGDFRADYRFVEGKGIEKTKTYEKLALPQVVAGPQGKVTVAARAVYVMGAQASLLPSQVEVSEELRQLGLTSLGKAKLMLNEERRGDYAAAAALSTLRWVGPREAIAVQGSPADERKRKRELLGDAKLGDLLADLARLPAAGDTLQERHKTLARLRALFDLDPRSVADAVGLLKSGKAGANTSALLGALSDAETSEARDALVDIGRDSTLGPELRADAITNLSLDEAPVAQTFGDLQELSGSSEPAVRDSALLGLGTAARQGADSEETRTLAEQASADLTRRFGSADGAPERELLLDSLGNAGGEAALKAAESALADPNPAIRAAAVSSLRFAPAPRADALIARVWTTDPEAQVRGQATMAASFRPSLAPLAETAILVLQKDASVSVRVGVTQLMADYIGEFPAFAAVLADAVKNDSSDDVKVAAARALGNAPPQPVP